MIYFYLVPLCTYVDEATFVPSSAYVHRIGLFAVVWCTHHFAHVILTSNSNIKQHYTFHNYTLSRYSVPNFSYANHTFFVVPQLPWSINSHQYHLRTELRCIPVGQYHKLSGMHLTFKQTRGGCFILLTCMICASNFNITTSRTLEAMGKIDPTVKIPVHWALSSAMVLNWKITSL